MNTQISQADTSSSELENITPKSWKPKLWVAILVGLIFNAFALLYVNRPRLFLLYFIFANLVVLFEFAFLSGITDLPILQFVSISLVFNIICPIHACFIIRGYDENSKRGWYSKLWVIPASYVVIVTSIFCFRSFLYEPFTIPAESMMPNYGRGDIVLVKKFGFGRYGTFGFDVLNLGVSDEKLMERGHVYVFYPPNKEVVFVKRLIGLPGDEISFGVDGVSINGQKLLTSFSVDNRNGFVEYKEMIGEKSYSISRSTFRPFSKSGFYKVPEGHYFMLGDSRDNSLDSRFWGTVDSNSIVGEVVHVFKNKQEATLSEKLN